jgi:hypothetical protein
MGPDAGGAAHKGLGAVNAFDEGIPTLGGYFACVYNVLPLRAELRLVDHDEGALVGRPTEPE